MASSQATLDICNLALSWIDQSPIQSFDQDSKAAYFCKTNYAALRDAVLEETDWSFATRRMILNVPLVEPPLWGFSYAFALDPIILRVQYANDDGHNEQDPNPDFNWTVEERVLLTDVEVVYIKATVKKDNPADFSAGFVMALAARLAFEMAVPIARSSRMAKEYAGKYEAYRGNAANTDGRQGRSRAISSTVLTGARNK